MRIVRYLNLRLGKGVMRVAYRPWYWPFSEEERFVYLDETMNWHWKDTFGYCWWPMSHRLTRLYREFIRTRYVENMKSSRGGIGRHT